MKDLLEILPGSQVDFLNNIKELPYFSSPAQLNEIMNNWETRGVEVKKIGSSLHKKPIYAAVFEPSDFHLKEYRKNSEKIPTVLAWGYPHPDEPLGAEALVLLGDALLEDRYNDLELNHLRFVFILCADPDNASLQLWHGDSMLERTGEARLPSPSEYFFGVWRPTHLGLEIDYAFPIDYGPFDQPKDYVGACHMFEECQADCSSFKNCFYKEEPYGPLQESLALVAAMEEWRPDIVFSMHSNHTGGDYTFLFLRESKKTLKALTQIPEAFSHRHLGEPLDRGHRWSHRTPDLFRERNLSYRENQIKRMDGYIEGERYLGNASAVNWIEANLPGTQFICPEATLLRSKDFEDTTILEQEIDVYVLQSKNSRGAVVNKYYYGDMYFAQEKVDSSALEDEGLEQHEDHTALGRRSDNWVKERMILPRALLGVEALQHRRDVLHQIDLLWDELHEKIEFADYPELTHVFRDERNAITVPGKFVGDQSMLIFRSRPDYLKPNTIAQAATFRYFWSAQTAFVVGNFNNYLQYILSNAERFRISAAHLYLIEECQQKLLTLQESELLKLPEEMKKITTRPALQSILGRMFLLINRLNDERPK